MKHTTRDVSPNHPHNPLLILSHPHKPPTSPPNHATSITTTYKHGAPRIKKLGKQQLTCSTDPQWASAPSAVPQRSSDAEHATQHTTAAHIINTGTGGYTVSPAECTRAKSEHRLPPDATQITSLAHIDKQEINSRQNRKIYRTTTTNSAQATAPGSPDLSL